MAFAMGSFFDPMAANNASGEGSSSIKALIFSVMVLILTTSSDVTALGGLAGAELTAADASYISRSYTLASRLKIFSFFLFISPMIFS